jgi:hypothetical protein
MEGENTTWDRKIQIRVINGRGKECVQESKHKALHKHDPIKKTFGSSANRTNQACLYIRRNSPERISLAFKDDQEKRQEGGIEGWHENPSMSRAKCNGRQVPIELHGLAKLGQFITGLLYKHFTHSIWAFTAATTACSCTVPMNDWYRKIPRVLHCACSQAL